jgi:hypothetical protein
LAATKGLYTSLEVATMLKQKLAKGGAFEETVAEYHPGLDPTKTLDVTYSRAKDAPPREVIMRMGDSAFVSEVDEHGIVKNRYSDLGRQKLSILRQHVHGKP